MRILPSNERWGWCPPRYTEDEEMRLLTGSPHGAYWVLLPPRPVEFGPLLLNVVHESKIRWGLTRRNGAAGLVRLYWHQEGFVSLDDIVLQPDHRRHGVGTALLAEVIAFAERLGASGIGGRMQAAEGDLPRLRGFYARAGFTIDDVWFWQDLPRPPVK
jgi:GNAT superfamily N-acetyltransferase